MLSPAKTPNFRTGFSRIKNIFLSKIHFIAFLLLFGLISTNTVHATVYETSWLTATVDNCLGTVTLDFVIYCDVDNDDDDDVWEAGSKLQMKVGTGDYFDIGEMGHTYNAAADHIYDGQGGDYYWYNELSTYYQTVVDNWASGTTTTDRPHWIRLKFRLKEGDQGKDISFRTVGTWQGGGSPGEKSDFFSRTPDLGSIQVSDKTICEGVKIDWTVPSELCSGAVIQIIRGNILLTTQPATDLTYTDVGAANYTSYEYRARFYKGMEGGWNNVGGYSAYSTGEKKTPPGYPSGFVASDINCDNTIDVSWDYSTGIDNVRLKRGADTLATLNKNITSYNDEVPTRGVPYSYYIMAENNCGWGAYSPATIGISPTEPDPTPTINSEIVPGIGVRVSWEDVSLESSYKLERNLLGGGGSTFIPISKDTTHYLDSSIIACQSYEYRVYSINHCAPTGIVSNALTQAKLVPDLSNTFQTNSLIASKGFFSNRVDLTWSVENNENLLDGYRIYRKELGSAMDPTLIESPNSGSNIAVDFLVDAGVLYEYSIIAETQCEQTTIYSNTATSIGFRSPFGTVTGNVSYSGNIAVNKAKITASSTAQIFGKSLEFSGDDYLSIPYSSSVNASDELLLEAWINPANFNEDFDLFRKETYCLKYTNSTNSIHFEILDISAAMHGIHINADLIKPGNYTHIAAQYFQDSIKIFLNGMPVANKFVSTEPIDDYGSDITIGTGYVGLMDEVRIWNKGKTDELIYQDYSRLMIGGESGLMAYLRLNEGIGEYAYDISKQGSLFNRNHASFQVDPQWSSTIPSTSQLSLAAYTDSLGNYLMTIPYNGIGEAFIISPSFLSHNFNPSTRALFIGDGSSIYNNIDFEDNSSFNIQGSLFYQSTSCAVKDAFLKIDGEYVLVNGAPVQTDASGNFSLQVPIGDHFISVEQSGHVYSVGRFPETGTYNFQADLAGINFQDSTLVKVVGRVVGGLREAVKIPGLGRSKNNIGVAEITLKSEQGNGCSTQTLLTDSATGEYTAYLPPMKYIPTVKVLNNLTIDFGVLNIVYLSGTPILTTKYDSVINSDNELVRIDSISYHKQLDYIHRVNPQMIVKSNDGINDFIGDTTYTYVNTVSGDTIVRNLRTDPFQWPVFHQQDPDFLYRCLIKVYEEYTNFDNAARDSVPSTDGKLIFHNELSHLPDVEIKLEDVNTPEEIKFLIYSFKPGAPNFLTHSSITEYSYTKKFELSIETSAGVVIPWLPVPPAKIPTGGDAVFRGVILGVQATGEQFVTTGPQIPEYILRDPPGSDSYASREEGSTKSEVRSWKWNLGAAAHTEDNIFLGANFSIGLGVSTTTEIENNVTAGFTAEVTGGNSGSINIKTTNDKTWSTNSQNYQTGAGSDLYIGKSQNIQFGIAEHLTLVPDSLCGQVECLGQSFDGYSYAKKYGLSIVPEGYETNFMYDQNHIINYLLPDLENLRDKVLQTNPKFNSHINIRELNYGKNNDDPVFGTDVSTITPGVGEYADFDGLSYLFIPATLQDSVSGDSVRFLNEQIAKWEEAIRLNEWEKVNIGNQSAIDSLETVELDKLWEKYKKPVIAYNILTAVNGVGGGVVAFGLIATPVPGTAFAGYATFALTTAAGIAHAELFEEASRYYILRDKIEDKFDNIKATNYSISGGNSFTSSITQESASTYTRSFEYNMSAELKLEVKGKVNNNGVGFEKSIEMKYSSGKDWTDESSDTETVAFTLSDPDQGDYFSVDVFPSIYGWGPVFKTRAGGKTSCPHEDEIKTQYYNPGTVISERTLQREKPVISASPSILTNVPTDVPAVFNLTLGNATESGDNRIYAVNLALGSNPFGALVSIDGFSPAQSIAIPANSSINKVLTIEKGPGAVYDYDSLLILIHSECQFESGTSDNVDIVDSVYVSAHFLPTCTDVSLASPEEQWVLNNSYRDTMQVAIDDYDINFFDLKSLRFDYKPSNEADWTGLQTFWRDTTGLNDATLSLIPQSTPFTLYDWDVSQMTDGTYDIRVQSLCALADNTSITYTGIIDRINPHAFGNPRPADGILDPNDQISIKFNEPIDLGSLTTKNFDIRGVINGTESDHYTHLSFDGIDDYLEVSAGASLQNRDFTIEFSVRRQGFGEQAIISQGVDSNASLFIGFNSDNNFVLRINETEIASSRVFTDNNWHTFAVSYSYYNRTAELYVIDGTMNGILNNGNTTINDIYRGSGKLLIGKNSSNDTDFFNGNIHDVRLWSKSRTLSEFSILHSQILNENEMGLLYNWRVDEAEGIIAKEHVRRRDAFVFGPTWEVDPNGNAITFNGTDNYLKVSTGDVVITDEMDFTIEFWFNSTQTEASTLFSNGSAERDQVDSLYSWNINKDENGIIHVKNYGLDFIATNTNYFEGKWHHFALVLKRTGNLSAYIDGELQNSMNATEFKQLGGSFMCLGARIYGNYADNIEDFFEGNMDEFRFWNTARKQEQIKRDKQNRMQGTELALLMYFPFENYALDPTGVPILTASLNEQISSDHVLSGTLPTLIEQTPTIKLQRPVEAISFSFSVNNDEIILVPNTSKELIENVTLDVTVKGVKDLNGNSMTSPVTWIAYVDKNQVMWDEQQINLIKIKDEPLSFTATVLNTGGELKEYTIDNLPAWLEASPKSGDIEPNSSQTINFTINPAVNIGVYDQDIFLRTDFNFDEKLALNLEVYVEPPLWSVDPEQYQYSMNIIGNIKIGEIFSTDEGDMVGAFVGNECRGAASLIYNASYDKYLLFLDVFSNDSSHSETVEYRIWNASEGIVHSVVDPSHTFDDTFVKGSPSSPILFQALNSSRKEISLPSGWKWVSFNLNSADLLDLNVFLESIDASEGDQIKGHEPFANYTDENGWSGSLNASGINLAEMYMIRLSNPDTLIIRGEEVNPEDIPINLFLGWNRIGYLSSSNMTIANALGQHNPYEGDLIKSQGGFAIYDASFHEWIGTLSYLKPGSGYMYYSANPDLATFFYPMQGLLKSAFTDDGSSDSDPWPIDNYKYPSSLTIMAEVNTELPEDDKSACVLGAFINDECRGYAYPLDYPGYDKPVFFLNIMGEAGENLIKFRLMNTVNGQQIEAITTTTFVPEEILGSSNDFFDINFGANNIDLSDPHSSSIEIYPNPFHSELQIQLKLTSSDQIHIEIFNITGEKVNDFGSQNLPAGISEFIWNGKDRNGNLLQNGVYLIRIIQRDEIQMKRVEIIR